MRLSLAEAAPTDPFRSIRLRIDIRTAQKNLSKRRRERQEKKQESDREDREKKNIVCKVDTGTTQDEKIQRKGD